MALYIHNRKVQKDEASADFRLLLVKILTTVYKSQIFYIKICLPKNFDRIIVFCLIDIKF